MKKEEKRREEKKSGLSYRESTTLEGSNDLIGGAKVRVKVEVELFGLSIVRGDCADLVELDERVDVLDVDVRKVGVSAVWKGAVVGRRLCRALESLNVLDKRPRPDEAP